MNIRNTLLLLSMITICSTSIGMQPDPQPQNQPDNKQQEAKKTSQEEVDAAKAKYYTQKTAESVAAQEINKDSHSWKGIAEEEATKQTVGMVFGWLNNGISRGFDEGRKYFFGPSEEEKMIEQGQKLDNQIKEESLRGHVLNNEATAAAKETKDKELILAEKQELHYDIENADKVGARLPGTYNNTQFKKRWRELAAKTGIEIPEEPAKDTKKTEQKDKKSLLSKLATPFVFVLTTAGNAADVVAGYSFAHVTDLDCFKDTFVQTPTFNRVLVVATIAGATYGGYKLYKSRYSDENDDNILDLD